MELGSHLLQELQPEQAWLEMAGDSYGSSLEFSGFNMSKQEESMPRAGSSQRKQPAEKKSDQHPTRSDGVAKTNSNKIKSDESQRLKKEGNNHSDSLHKHRGPPRSRRTSSVSRSGKSLSQSTHGDDHFYRHRPSPSPGPKDLGRTSRVHNSNGTDLEMADVCSSLPLKARRANKHL